MTKLSRRNTALLFLGVCAVAAVGCGNESGDGPAQTGQMNLPLTAQGASGLTYRLRNATFRVYGSYGYGDAAGSGSENVVVLSSETDPNARSISVSLEEGPYTIELQPGWSIEKDEGGEASPVEATLLNGSTQWVWIYRQSTSFAQFSFGIGGREVWLNGKLNIGIDVQEVPGSAGAGGESSLPTPPPAAGAGGSES